jgi:hypothetical protein
LSVEILLKADWPSTQSNEAAIFMLGSSSTVVIVNQRTQNSRATPPTFVNEWALPSQHATRQPRFSDCRVDNSLKF